MRSIAFLFVVAALLYLAICGLMWFAQDSMIFLCQPLQSQAVNWARSVGAQELRVSSKDGIQLHGWFRKASHSGPSPFLIYFGGNAEEVSGMLHELARYPEMSIALFNYRGYGLSEGTPSESALFADSLVIYDTVATRSDVDPKRIIIMGRSLGSGVATYVASRRSVRAVVLISPYDSLTALAAHFYPWLPVSHLMRHRFDSVSRAPEIRAPMLAMVGTLDSIVPPANSQRLVRAWKGQGNLHLLRGADHNDLLAHPEFWQVVDQFVKQATN
jgi:uncharacterized protein